MPVTQFPRDQYWKIMGSPETWNGGGITFEGRERLKYMRPTMLKVGTDPGASEFRLALFHDDALTNRFSSSAWIKLTEIESSANVSGTWRCDTAFSFTAAPWLDASKQYFMAVESQGYTRNAAIFYVAFQLDWTYPVNTPNADPNLQRGLKVEVYTERKAGFA